MAVMIDGKAVSARLRQKMAAEVAAMKEAGVVPGLAVVLVGENPASQVYVRTKIRPVRSWASAPRTTASPRIPPRRLFWTW